MTAIRHKNFFDIFDQYIAGPFNLGMLFRPPATNGDDVIRGSVCSDTIDGKGGNDTIWAGKGNDNVSGGDGNDKLYGEHGNDTLAGGKGNDSIDGGAGVDVLKLLGLKSSYDVDLLGNGSIRVTDLVSGRDGVDIAKDVETVQFSNGQACSLLDLALPSLSFIADGAVPAQYLTPDGKLPYGSQSTDENGFGMVTSDEGTTLGLAGRYRTVNEPEDPVSSVIEQGGRVLHSTFHFNDGPQSTANGSNSNNPNRASANADYFIADDDTPLAQLLNQGFQFEWSVVSTTGVNVRLHAVVDTATLTDIKWVDQNGVVYISDDGGGAFSAFNSMNPAGFWDPAKNYGPRTEEVRLEMFDANHVLIQGVHDTLIYA